jgi:hypothetical protein
VEVFVLTEIYEDPASVAERLISNRTLDKEAATMEASQKAAEAAAAEGGKGGH